MLRDGNQIQMSFSNYSELYDLLVPKDNLYRIINDNVDFSFVTETLKDKYCLDNGRDAINPVIMFKYLIIKDFEELSDADVVRHSLYDLSMKYFLGLDVEETQLIDPSSLTKFRKLRLEGTDLLDRILEESVKLGIKKGVIKNKGRIVVDATHTKARYNAASPRDMLIQRSKALRKTLYSHDETIRERLPKKAENTGILEDMIEYCKELIAAVENDERFVMQETVQERKRYLEEGIKDIEEKLEVSYDSEAKTGHKTADTNFFGYKTHLAVTQEGIAVAAVMTSGEKTDGQYLEELIDKSNEAGMEVKEVLGDKAYSPKSNIEMTKEKGIKLISRLSESVVNGNRKENHGFEFNKDAQMYQCPMGQLAIRKCRSGKEDEKCIVYYFDVEVCKSCPQKEGCYKEGAKSRTFSEKIKAPEHLEQLAFEKTEEFESKIKDRYVIEQTNAILKNSHGYGVAKSKGISGLEIQGSIALFNMNIKKILFPSKPRNRKKQK